MPREDPVKFMFANMARRMPVTEMERLGLVPSRSDATILFSRYPDGTLRLYKRGSIIDDVPAGYSEENVTVKALVKRDSEEFMVVIPITRTQLDTPSAEQFLHETAYSHRHKKAEDYNESSKPNDSESGTSRNYLCSKSAAIYPATSDHFGRRGEGSPDAMGTDERGEDSTP